MNRAPFERPHLLLTLRTCHIYDEGNPDRTHNRAHDVRHIHTLKPDEMNRLLRAQRIEVSTVTYRRGPNNTRIVESAADAIPRLSLSLSPLSLWTSPVDAFKASPLLSWSSSARRSARVSPHLMQLEEPQPIELFSSRPACFW